MSKKKLLSLQVKFIGASFVIILFFTLLPLIYSLGLSLYSGRANQLEFSGFDNYIRLFSDETVLNSLFNTVLFSVVLIPVVLILSIVIANAVNKLKSSRLKSVVLMIIFFPSITSPVAYSFFFKQLFSTNGLVNISLNNLGILNNAVNFLLTPSGAKIAIILTCVWAWTGWYSLLIYSALQNIEPQVIKAAKIDGASNLRILLKIVLPSIKPVILLSSVLLTGSVIQIFSEVMIISKGGPQGATLTLAYYIYRLSFEYVSQFGYAAAISVIILVLSVITCLIQIKLGEKSYD